MFSGLWREPSVMGWVGHHFSLPTVLAMCSRQALYQSYPNPADFFLKQGLTTSYVDQAILELTDPPVSARLPSARIKGVNHHTQHPNKNYCFFETGSQHVALAGLKPTMKTRLALNCEFQITLTNKKLTKQTNTQTAVMSYGLWGISEWLHSLLFSVLQPLYHNYSEFTRGGDPPKGRLWIT